MESIEMSLNTLAFVNISNEIDNHLNVLYCNYESLQSYALLIGSKGDSYQKNNMFINTLSLCIKELVKIYEIIIYTGEHQFIHKNEKVECLFKIKPKVKDTNLFVDKLFALFFVCLEHLFFLTWFPCLSFFNYIYFKFYIVDL